MTAFNLLLVLAIFLIASKHKLAYRNSHTESCANYHSILQVHLH